MNRQIKWKELSTKYQISISIKKTDLHKLDSKALAIRISNLLEGFKQYERGDM